MTELVLVSDMRPFRVMWLAEILMPCRETVTPEATVRSEPEAIRALAAFESALASVTFEEIVSSIVSVAPLLNLIVPPPPTALMMFLADTEDEMFKSLAAPVAISMLSMLVGAWLPQFVQLLVVD